MPSLRAHEEAGVEPSEISRCLEDHGIPCFELVPLSIARDRRQLSADLDEVARYAEAIRPQQVLTTIRDPVDAALVDALRFASSRVAPLGATLSIEFMPTSPLTTLPEASALVDELGIGSVRLVVDSWHLLRRPTWSAEIDRLGVERIGFVQLNDAPAGTVDDSRVDSMESRVLPGEGELPLVEFARALMARGFDGVVSVEVLSNSWRVGPLDQFVARARAAAQAVWREAERRSRLSGTT